MRSGWATRESEGVGRRGRGSVFHFKPCNLPLWARSCALVELRRKKDFSIHYALQRFLQQQQKKNAKRKATAKEEHKQNTEKNNMETKTKTETEIENREHSERTYEIRV